MAAPGEAAAEPAAEWTVAAAGEAADGPAAEPAETAEAAAAAVAAETVAAPHAAEPTFRPAEPHAPIPSPTIGGGEAIGAPARKASDPSGRGGAETAPEAGAAGLAAEAAEALTAPSTVETSFPPAKPCPPAPGPTFGGGVATAAEAPAVERAVAAVGAALECAAAIRPTTAAADARSRAPEYPADTRKCFGCGEPGHLRRNCPAQVYAVASEPVDAETEEADDGEGIDDSGEEPTKEELQQNIAEMPDHGPLHRMLGDLLLNKGDVHGAEAAYREGTKRDPTWAPNFFHLACCLRQRNDIATAERVARAGLRLDPADATGHRELGEILERKGETAGAAASFAEADRLVAKEAEDAKEFTEEEKRSRLEELARLQSLSAEKRQVLARILSKASMFSVEASKDLAHTLAGGGGNAEKHFFHHGALLAKLMDHPDLAVHFVLNAPKPWLKLANELGVYYDELRDLGNGTMNLGKKAAKRMEAEYRAAGKPTFDFFSSKKDKALLGRFVEYWSGLTSLSRNLLPSHLSYFIEQYDFYCGEQPN